MKSSSFYHNTFRTIIKMASSITKTNVHPWMNSQTRAIVFNKREQTFRNLIKQINKINTIDKTNTIKTLKNQLSPKKALKKCWFQKKKREGHSPTPHPWCYVDPDIEISMSLSLRFVLGGIKQSQQSVVRDGPIRFTWFQLLYSFIKNSKN